MITRLKDIREDRGFSQQQLADQLGTTKTQISKLELGQRRMTMEWAKRLAVPLECHWLELMPDPEAPPAPKLSPDEQALLDLYRGLTEHEQSTFRTVADALAKSSGADAAARKKGGKGG